MSVIDKIRKRRAWPVTIEGETVLVRALLDSEEGEVKPFANDPESYGYAIGCCLLGDDGLPCLKRMPDEESKAFGARVLTELDLPADTRAELCDRILKLATGPPIESLKKN